MKTGYSIKTWRMRLYCPELDMLGRTEQLYQETVDFYYEILQTRESLWTENLLSIQRALEELTVPGRDGRVPLYTPPQGKLPVYFRRSAMNKAGIAVKSAITLQENQTKEIIFPEKIEASMTFFKGMYREISDTAIELKLWDGKKWKWISCQMEGRPFPKDGTILSPSLSHSGKLLMLHVPVKQETSDARTAKERVQSGSRICSVQFTNTDIFAMCCVLDENGKQLAVRACRGGNTYRHQAEQALKKLQRSRKFTEKDNIPHADRKHYQYLKHLNEHYAHQVSREITNFCKEQKADMILLPVYGKDFSRMAMYQSGNYSPFHLSTRIRNYLTYKAWSEGILVLELRGEGTGKKCSICGADGTRTGKIFTCKNGHQLNRHLNEARNLGLRSRETFRKNGFTKNDISGSNALI